MLQEATVLNNMDWSTDVPNTPLVILVFVATTVALVFLMICFSRFYSARRNRSWCPEPRVPARDAPRRPSTHATPEQPSEVPTFYRFRDLQLVDSVAQ